MNKFEKFLLLIVIILIISVVGLYNMVIKLSKQTFNSTLTNAEGDSKLSSRVSELEDKVEKLENLVENNN